MGGSIDRLRIGSGAGHGAAPPSIRVFDWRDFDLARSTHSVPGIFGPCTGPAAKPRPRSHLSTFYLPRPHMHGSVAVQPRKMPGNLV